MNEKEQIVSTLRELHSLASNNGSVALSSQIEEEIHKVEKSEFYLVVLGQFKRGKTSFINALLGEEFLPVGVIPVTAIVTLIRYGGKKKIEVIFSTGRRQPIEALDLPQYVTEKGNPNNEKGVRSVELTHPSEFLHDGIVLVDTPGIGSISLNNTKTTQEFLPHIDAAIIVLSSDPPITQAENEFVNEVRAHVDRIFFVLNKIDTMSNADISETIIYTQEVIRKKTGALVEVYPISALSALKGKKGKQTSSLPTGNTQAIEKAIQLYLKKEKLQQLFYNSVKRIQRFANELKFTTELNLKAIETPLIDLQTKIETFNRYLETLQHDRQQTFILAGELALLKGWIAEELRLFQKTETLKLHEDLSHWISNHEDISSREFLKSVEKTMMNHLTADFEKWRLPKQQEIMSRFNNILTHASREMNLIIEKIVQYSANLFNVTIEVFPQPDPPPVKPTFTYKIKDDPMFIEIDMLKFSSRFFPAAISRRIITRKMKAKIAEKVMVNCGRLLSDFVTDLEEQYRHFQYDLDEKSEETANNIKRILSDATKYKSESASAIASHVTILRQQLQHLNKLALHPNTIAVPLHSVDSINH